MRDLIFDIETYKNLFSITFKDMQSGNRRVFEISPWCDQWESFKKFVKACSSDPQVRWVGFRNYFFDYPVIHNLIHHNTDPIIYRAAYREAQKIIDAQNQWDNVLWDNAHLVPQVDLYRIHHFDNIARATSLKVLEFNMRSDTVQDLPYSPHIELTEAQKDEVLAYNIHDVDETAKFYLKTLDMIRFREELTAKYGRNFINHNDTKIGKDYFIMELEKAGVKCYSYTEDGVREPVQTPRERIRINDIIFPYVKFERPEFNAVLKWLRQQDITETKGVFTEIDNLGDLEKYANLKEKKGKVKNLNCIVDGFQFDFGTGGIHGSVESTIVEEDDKYAVIDYDVTSLYPSIAIVNGVYPKHLTHKFCEIGANIKNERVSYLKGTLENKALKLALNGGMFGDSNNKFSPFYDPQYTMTITINGQLLLCMLAERLMNIPDLRLIQINTDGVTIKVKRSDIERVERINSEWQDLTGLELERADYSKMFIRDVNNYIGLYTDGKVKRKGKYEYDLEWNKNHSSLVVQKAVEAHLLHGKDVQTFIENHDDVYDFMLRTKIPRNSALLWGDERIQNVTRYYMSPAGRYLTKIMPPNKGDTKPRRISIHDGWKAQPMNTMREVKDIDYRWYVNEANKLITPLYHGKFNELFE